MEKAGVEESGAAIRRRIESALVAKGHPTAIAADAAFHLTDWLHDLDGLNAFFREPDSFSDAEVASLLYSILQHVPDHMAAAAKLLVDAPVTDVFGVGAVDMTYEDKVAQFRLRLEVWGDYEAADTIEFPSSDQIRDAVLSLDGDRYFGARIGLHEWYFLQANICTDPSENTFEFHRGSSEELFKCDEAQISVEGIIKAFQQFAIGDHSWKEDFTWTEAR